MCLFMFRTVIFSMIFIVDRSGCDLQMFVGQVPRSMDKDNLHKNLLVGICSKLLYLFLNK